MADLANIFGAPGTGVHSLRFLNIAVVDTVATVVAAYGLAHYFQWSFWLILFILFVVGELLHVVVGVKTAVAKWLTRVE